MTLMIFSAAALLILILFISKRASIREKLLGMSFYYMMINVFVLYASSNTGITNLLAFMNIVNIAFLFFFLILIKYLTAGEK